MEAADKKNTKRGRGGKKARERPARVPERQDLSEARRRYDLAVLDSKSGELIQQLNERLGRLEKREPESLYELLGLARREPEGSTLAHRAIEMALTKREAIQRVLSEMRADERAVSRADEIGIASLVASVHREMPTEQRERLVRELKRIPAKSREDFLCWLREMRAEKIRTLTAERDDLAALEADLDVLRELVPRLREGLAACFPAEYENKQRTFMKWELAKRMLDSGMSRDEVRAAFPDVDALKKPRGSKNEDQANSTLARQVSRYIDEHYVRVE